MSPIQLDNIGQRDSSRKGSSGFLGPLSKHPHLLPKPESHKSKGAQAQERTPPKASPA